MSTSTSMMKYGALITKAKAMYGKRLKGSDFHHMASLGTVSEVMEYLRRQGGWEEAVDAWEGAHDSADISRLPLEHAFRDQFRTEYLQLLHFVPKGDQALVSFPVLLTDLEGILHALRRLHAGHVRQSIPLPEPYASRSRVDHAALTRCTDFDGLIAATRRSIFHEPLQRLKQAQPDVLPDYTATEALLKSTYYSHMYRIIHKYYSGQTQNVLLKSFGLEIDMLNILHVLRLKRFFPEEQEYFSTMFPFHYRLKPDTLHAMCSAASLSAAVQLVEASPYGKIFRDMSLREMEIEFRRQIYVFNRRQLFLGAAPAYAAVAYLNLKEQEIKALINVIESVHYGIPYTDSIPV